MFVPRRAFLKTTSTAAASAFTIPALLRARDLLSLSQTQESTMEIKRIGSQPSSKGPADWFTGTVRIDRLFQASLRPMTCTSRRSARTAAGMTKEVTLEPVGGPINDSIDEAYHAKYHGSPYLSSMISALARSATVKIAPRESNA
jgi:Uncharacterized protein conserved in bacteria (DUF2255)